MKNQSRIFIGLVLLFVFSYRTFSQNLYHTGLLFASAPESKEARTSLDFTPDTPITVHNKFSLDFDFAIWSRVQFGYIFRIFYKQGHNIDLGYIPKSSNKHILFPIPQQERDANKAIVVTGDWN